jgi:hypothetical protein
MTKISEKIQEKYDEAFFDEVRFGIITALEFYKSANLKRLSVLVGRPETTTIRYVKKLLEDEIIEIDQVKTASDWGKFYKLTDPVLAIIDERGKEQDDRVKWIFDEIGDVSKKSDEEFHDFMTKIVLSKKDLEHDFHVAKQVFEFSTNVQKMILNDSIFAIKEFLQIKEEKGVDYIKDNLVFAPSDLEMWTSPLKIHSTKQLVQLINVFFKWQNELKQLGEKFEQEMDEKNIPDDQRRDLFLYSFLGSLEFTYELKNEKGGTK